MQKCNKCNTDMKLLFSSYYCINDCDRISDVSKPKNIQNDDKVEEVYYSYGSRHHVPGTKLRGPIVFKTFDIAKKYRDMYNPKSTISKFKASQIKKSSNLSFKDDEAFEVVGFAEFIENCKE